MGKEESWEDVLRALLGEEGARQALEAMKDAGLDPAVMGDAAGLPSDPAQLQFMLTQMQALLAASDGPVNWDLAQEYARQQLTSDPPLTAADSTKIRTALQVADLLLDPVTELTAPAPERSALTRQGWLHATLPVFRTVATPVAEHIVDAMAGLLDASSFEEQLPAELSQFGGTEFGAIPGLVRKLGAAAFGMQLGGAVAHLAREAFGLTDIGLPLGAPGTVALVGANVTGFADGLDVPPDEVLQFLAVREAAHARLYGASPWLYGHVLTLITTYASGIAIDTDAMADAFRAIDPSDPQQLRDAMSSGIFALEVSADQKRALANLETTLAVIEGWVEYVTSEATRAHLDHTVALTEMIRRRRASGGPAESTFKNLVGLELRPRRLRDAAALWQLLTERRGVEARDALWHHPDLMPTAADLDNPAGLLNNSETSELDAALAELLGPDPDDPTIA